MKLRPRRVEFPCLAIRANQLNKGSLVVQRGLDLRMNMETNRVVVLRIDRPLCQELIDPAQLGAVRGQAQIPLMDNPKLPQISIMRSGNP